MSLIKLTPWMQPYNQTCEVCKGFGYGLVIWPSGRRTLEMYAFTAVISDFVLKQTITEKECLRRAYENNLYDSAQDFRQHAHPSGWFIRWGKRKRPKARAVKSVVWIHPDSYDGPVPIQGNRI